MAKKTIVAEAEQMIKPTEPANVPAEPAIETPEAKKPKTVKKEKQVKKPEAVVRDHSEETCQETG